MINGIVSDLLKSVSHWFLYIFIAADAPLNKDIMRKRENQIKWLKRLDAVNGYYSYNDLVLIVQEGIIERYGKTPAEILTTLYTTGKPSVSSVLGNEAEKTKLALDNLAIPTKNTSTGVVEEKNFWTGVMEVLSFIKELLKILGIGDPKEIEPTSTEWVNADKNNSSMLSSVGDILPWVMGGSIIWFLSTNNGKGKNKAKKGK